MKILKPKVKLKVRLKRPKVKLKIKVLTKVKTPNKVKILKPKSRLDIDEAKILKRKIDSILSKMPEKLIWCKDYAHFKDFVVCAIRCDPPCNFYQSYRWMCKAARCVNYIHCKKRGHRCKEMSRNIDRAERSVEMYRKWRKMMGRKDSLFSEI